MQNAVLLTLVAVAGTTSSAVAADQGAPVVLPDRYLHCVLGRSTNIDPNKMQSTADVISEGRYRFVVRLPPVAVRTTAPPDPSDPPEPVDPRTRVIVDSDGLAKDMAPNFVRVIDLWPKRVEMLGPIPSSTWARMIIVSAIDPEKKQAHLFMTRVKDAATLDLQAIYQGQCRIDTRRPGRGIRQS